MLEELTAVLDGPCGTDGCALADGESVVELYRCLSRLEAVATRASAAFDAGGEWASEGARSAPAWLSVSTKAPKSIAARRVRVGRPRRGGGHRRQTPRRSFPQPVEGPRRQLADATVVSPGSLVHWLDEAWVERIVFDGPSRVMDVGVTRRLFDGATRRAVEAMFPECYQKYCDVPAERCQADHVEPYGAGGLTLSTNGRMACGFHNRWRHRGAGPPTRE